MREGFEQLLRDLRPKLHRYCARMTGSVIEGEDVLQDALVKAVEALPRQAALEHPEAWVFRIAHNAALDFLRRRARQEAAMSEEELALVADPVSAADVRVATAARLRSFLELPVAQRSSVILMDVLGYSLQEIGTVLQASLPAVKANLHRGRARLRELAQAPDTAPAAVLDPAERARLARYVDRFNAGDFAAVRDMLAEEVRLDLVNRTRLNGRAEVSGVYFANYARINAWILAPGLVDGRPAILARERRSPDGPPSHFILLRWADKRVLGIRDFLHAPYAMEGAELQVAP